MIKKILLSALLIQSLTAIPEASQTAKAEKKINISRIDTLHIKNSRQLYAICKKSQDPLKGDYKIEEGKGDYILSRFTDGYAEGTWKYYKGGKLSAKETYAGGRLEGEKISYYSDGKTKDIIPYKKGKAEGNARGYFPNGNIKYEKTFTDGMEEGETRNYAESGMLINKTEFEKGKPTGKITEVVHAGRYNAYTISMNMANGIKYGDYSETYANGFSRAKGKYSYDEKDGLWVYGNLYGQKTASEIYEKGEIINKTTYYPNGKIKTEYGLKNGEKEGTEKRYDDMGNLLTEKNFEGGKQIGTQIIYISSTLVDYKKIYNYNEKGLPDGKYMEIYTQSEITKTQGYYADGMKTGKWEFFNSQGQPTVVENYLNDKLVSSRILIN